LEKTIYIGNLSFSTTEEVLMNEFSKLGQVNSARIIMDNQSGRSKGFGFVEMNQEDEAAKAISSLNGKKIDGRVIRVSYAETKISSSTDSSFSRQKDKSKKIYGRDSKSYSDNSF